MCIGLSGDPEGEAMHVPLGYNSRSGQRPKRRGHHDIDYSRIQQAESREVEVGHKRHSIDLRDSDRGVTSFGVCGRDGAECHLATAEALLRGLAAGVPWLLGKYGKETVGRNGGQGILMVGWSEVGVQPGEGWWDVGLLALCSSQPFGGIVMFEGVQEGSRCRSSVTKSGALDITDGSLPVTLQPAQLV